MADETFWLSQAQMVELFQSSKANVSEHITHIFEDGELDEQAVVRKFRTTAADGKTYQVTYYNLDVIISVGYRVKSLRGTQFRRWALGILREYRSVRFRFAAAVQQRYPSSARPMRRGCAQHALGLPFA